MEVAAWRMGEGGEGMVAGWPLEEGEVVGVAEVAGEVVGVAGAVGEVVGAAGEVAGLDVMVAGEAAGEKC